MERRRGTETIGDMIRSLGLVLLVVAFVGGLVALTGARPSPTRDVDYQAPLEQARDVAPFAVLAPPSLPEGWTTTRVSYTRGETDASGVWRMNLVTPQTSYIGLIQSTADLDRALRDELPDFEPDGEVQVDGQTWTRLVEVGVRDPDRALVLDRDDSAVILLGSGSYSELEDFAARLR